MGFGNHALDLVLGETSLVVGDGNLVGWVHLRGNFVSADGSLEGVAVVLKTILGFDTVSVGIILGLVLLGFGNHALDLVLRETSLVVGDGNLVLLTGGLFEGTDIQDTVGINVEANI